MKHFATSINISACPAVSHLMQTKYRLFIILWLFMHSNHNNRHLPMKSANAQETCNLFVHIMTSPLGQPICIHLIASLHCKSCCLFLFIPFFLLALTGPFMFLLFKYTRDDLRAVYTVSVLFVLPNYFCISGHWKKHLRHKPPAVFCPIENLSFSCPHSTIWTCFIKTLQLCSTPHKLLLSL